MRMRSASMSLSRMRRAREGDLDLLDGLVALASGQAGAVLAAASSCLSATSRSEAWASPL
jgi:hypothetical protein